MMDASMMNGMGDAMQKETTRRAPDKKKAKMRRKAAEKDQKPFDKRRFPSRDFRGEKGNTRV